MQHRSCSYGAQRSELDRLRTSGSGRDGRLHTLSGRQRRHSTVSSRCAPGSFVRVPEGGQPDQRAHAASRGGRTLGGGPLERTPLEGATIPVRGPLHRGSRRGDSSSSGAAGTTASRDGVALVPRCLGRPCSGSGRSDHVATSGLLHRGARGRHVSGGFVLKVLPGSPPRRSLRGTLRAAYLRGSSLPRRFLPPQAGIVVRDGSCR
jgi:hypothetical protein